MAGFITFDGPKTGQEREKPRNPVMGFGATPETEEATAPVTNSEPAATGDKSPERAEPASDLEQKLAAQKTRADHGVFLYQMGNTFRDANWDDALEPTMKFMSLLQSAGGHNWQKAAFFTLNQDYRNVPHALNLRNQKPNPVLRVLSSYGLTPEQANKFYPLENRLGASFVRGEQHVAPGEILQNGGHELYVPFKGGILLLGSEKPFTDTAQGLFSQVGRDLSIWMGKLDSINRDALTQLYGRKRFDSDFARAFRESVGTQNLGLAFFDLDDLKLINDRYGGHEAGDRYLISAANGTRVSLRGIDTAYRLGGDEFAIILRDVTYQKFDDGTVHDGAKVYVVERLLPAVKKETMKLQPAHGPFVFPYQDPISAGWVSMKGFVEKHGKHLLTKENFLKEADEWMYKHKEEYKRGRRPKIGF